MARFEKVFKHIEVLFDENLDGDDYYDVKASSDTLFHRVRAVANT